MKNIIFALLLVPGLVLADDDQATVSCNLAKAQAEVTAAELALPAAFATGSNQLTQKTVAVGVSQSISGLVRASKLRSAADAQCDSFQSSVRLEQYVLWATADIQKRGAIASVKILNQALDLSNENIDILKKQVDSNVSTVGDIDTAVMDYRRIEDIRAGLLATASIVIPSMDYINVADLINEFEANQGKAAELSAASTAHSGWDITIAVGENKPIGTPTYGTSDSAATFVTATVKYSFGTHAAMKAAEEIGRTTSQSLHIAQSGYTQTLIRRRTETQSLIELEIQNIANARREQTTLQSVRIPLAGIDSFLANNARRTLDIQLKALEADITGAGVRLAGYKTLLEKL